MGLFLWGSLFAQEYYNSCSQAFALCPNTTFSLSNINANATVCTNCEDDFTFCFSGENTIWMKFKTNVTGGNANINFSQLQFQNLPGQGNSLQAAIIAATVPCISSSYSLVSNCVSNGNNNFVLTANGLTPNTTYYVVVNGAMGTTTQAEATFDVMLSGGGVDQNASIIVSTPDNFICKGNTATFVAQTSGCTNKSIFYWYVNDSLIGSSLDSIFIYNQLSDLDEVTAKVTCFTYCTDTFISNSLQFNVASFLVDAGEDIGIRQGETVKLNGATSGNNITWSPPYTLNNPNIIQPIAQPLETTTYFLTVGNGNCTITDEVTITVKKGLTIPNTFSPNGDGINDSWDILGIDAFPNCQIEIFDRWGQMVFQTTGYPPNKRWKGTSKSGKALSASAYYYVIQLHKDQKEKPLKGVVSIIY